MRARFSAVSLRTPSRIRAPARCTSRSSSNCRMRFAWYWFQESTVRAWARWIAWTTLSSLIFDTARNAEISATRIAMALLKRSLPEAGGVSAGLASRHRSEDAITAAAPTPSSPRRRLSTGFRSCQPWQPARAHLSLRERCSQRSSFGRGVSRWRRSARLRAAPLPERCHRRDGEGVDTMVERIVGVAADPVEGHLVAAARGVEGAPEVLVLDRLPVGGLPAPRLPALDPRGDAEPDVLRVGVEIDGARARQRLERLDRGGELHAVVGGQRLAAGELLLAAFEQEQRRPAARPRIPRAGAVGVDRHPLAHRTSPYSAALATRR